MKNKLLLNPNGRNHIKVMPFGDLNLLDDEGDKIRLAQKLYNDLEVSPDAEKLYHTSNSAKGFMVSVWRLYDNYYLIQSIRNEFKTYNNVVYIMRSKNDALAIAKFLKENITTLMKDYKKQILDAKDMMAPLSEDSNDSGA